MIINDGKPKTTTLILAGHPDFAKKDEPKEEAQDPMDAFRAIAQDLIEAVKKDDADLLADALRAFITEHALAPEQDDSEEE
jgi:predicted lipid-binding transport protein (Tim44 family)